MRFEKYYLYEQKDYLTLYHGTIGKFVNDIKRNGLISRMGYDSPNWFMLSSDMESALFHTTPEENNKYVYVVEFKIPIINEKRRWIGYPYLWPPEERNDKSKWYSLRKEIPSKFINKIHKFTKDEWVDQKNKGF